MSEAAKAYQRIMQGQPSNQLGRQVEALRAFPSGVVGVAAMLTAQKANLLESASTNEARISPGEDIERSQKVGDIALMDQKPQDSFLDNLDDNVILGYD